MKATQIRKGNIVRIDGTLYKILNMDHVTPGKGRAHIQTKLRSLHGGTQTEKRFRSDEDVEKIQNEDRMAREMGVQGVPCFIVNNKYAVSGAQEPAVFHQLLDKVAAEATAERDQPADAKQDG